MGGDQPSFAATWRTYCSQQASTLKVPSRGGSQARCVHTLELDFKVQPPVPILRLCAICKLFY